MTAMDTAIYGGGAGSFTGKHVDDVDACPLAAPETGFAESAESTVTSDDRHAPVGGRSRQRCWFLASQACPFRRSKSLSRYR